MCRPLPLPPYTNAAHCLSTRLRISLITNSTAARIPLANVPAYHLDKAALNAATWIAFTCDPRTAPASIIAGAYTVPRTILMAFADPSSVVALLASIGHYDGGFGGIAAAHFDG